MIYSPALEPFLEQAPDMLDVLELEPQTMWLAEHPIDGPFSELEAGLARFADKPGHKLIHSVGAPLAGTRSPSSVQMNLVRRVAERFDSPWVSEHLSVAGTPHQAAGFLLPPLQTAEGVRVAAENIRAFRRGIGRPIAIETGVSYLKRKPFEMPDGEFVAAVAKAADCGILLDIHNIYCNERNGRGTMDDFVAALPLERVWEVHLAGGSEMDGVWLDAHSGPMHRELAVRAAEILRALPNLGALNFEIYDTFLRGLEASTLIRIVDQLRGLWSQVGAGAGAVTDIEWQPERPVGDLTAQAPTAELWEASLTEAVWKKELPQGEAFIADDGAIDLYSQLINSFRGSLLVKTVHRSLRYLFLTHEDRGDSVLESYFTQVPAQLFGRLEALAFRDWCSDQQLEDPIFAALLNYDIAVIESSLEASPQIVSFPGDPRPIFEALAAAEKPPSFEPPEWEIEILPDQAYLQAYGGASGAS